jgi:hypothetical protein
VLLSQRTQGEVLQGTGGGVGAWRGLLNLPKNSFEAFMRAYISVFSQFCKLMSLSLVSLHIAIQKEEGYARMQPSRIEELEWI